MQKNTAYPQTLSELGAVKYPNQFKRVQKGGVWLLRLLLLMGRSYMPGVLAALILKSVVRRPVRIVLALIAEPILNGILSWLTRRFTKEPHEASEK